MSIRRDSIGDDENQANVDTPLLKETSLEILHSKSNHNADAIKMEKRYLLSQKRSLLEEQEINFDILISKKTEAVKSNVIENTFSNVEKKFQPFGKELTSFGRWQHLKTQVQTKQESEKLQLVTIKHKEEKKLMAVLMMAVVIEAEMPECFYEHLLKSKQLIKILKSIVSSTQQLGLLKCLYDNCEL